MNGYLQRLALRAINPLESVHPVLGSVFSAPKCGRGREGFPVEGDDFPSIQVESVRPALGSVFSAPKYGREREGFPMKGDDLPGIQPESLVTPAPDPLRPFHDSRSGPLVRGETQPTLQGERTEKLRPISGEKTSFTPWVPQTQHGAKKEESNRESDLHRQRREQKAVSEHVYTPLITENFVRPNNQGIFRRELNAFASAAREKSNLSGRPVPTEREPDEIQIHIGRIEVTAIPQAAARAVTHPVRKGLNLEEYLRRRDRRA